MLGITLHCTSIPVDPGSGGGVEIPLVASCYAEDEHLPDGQLSRGPNFL